MCNKEVHELFIQEGQINCIFCNKQIQDPGKPKRYFCCDSMRLIKDDFIVKIVVKRIMNITLQNSLIFKGIDTGLERSLYITENITS